MKKQLLKYGIALLAVALLVFLDQWTKALAVTYLKDQADVILISGVLQLHYLENTGIAFGLFAGKQWVFALLTLLMLGIFGLILRKIQLSGRFMPLYILLIFLSSGAVGNLIDRLFLQYVVDFIYVSFIDFPVFNVADMYVTVSCFVLLFLLIFVYKEEELAELLPFRRKKEEENS